MLIKKEYKPLLCVNLILIIIFSFIFLSKANYEFLIYIGVIIFFLLVILLSSQKIDYLGSLLWGLSTWAFLHMAGGGLYFKGQKFYEVMLWPIVGEPYNILRYDQVVHAFGFGVATLVAYVLIKPYLKKENLGKISLSIVLVMAGLGMGALNEIVEFSATVILPETGVGGYENTALDLVFNLIGAIIAMFYILKKELPKLKINKLTY